jgi:hypothetical protein
VESAVRNTFGTAEKLEQGEAVTGGRSLEELVPKMPGKLARFLGWSSASYDEGDPEAPPEPNPLLAGRFDLGAAMSRGIEPPEELEPDVLLKGKIHHLFGPSESGKTMIALWLIKCRIEARQYVIFFDSENGPRTISERLQQMGADPVLVREYLVYLPFPDLTTSSQHRRNFYDALDAIRPSLIVFDSWASYLSASGYSENENAEVEHWDNALTKRAKQRGIASLILDHTPHDAIRSRGAARKKEVADVQWRVKKTQEFNRDAVGEVLLINEKDREGWLPGSVTFSIGGKSGTLTCRRSAGTIEEPDPEDGLTASQRWAFAALVEQFGAKGATASEWQKAADQKPYAVPYGSFYRCLRAIKDAGLVTLDDSGRDSRYFPKTPPDGGGGSDSEETRSDSGDSSNYHSLSDDYHDSADSGGAPANYQRYHPPLRGCSDDSGADSSGPAPPDGLTDEELRQYRRLVREGTKPKFARAAVLQGRKVGAA